MDNTPHKCLAVANYFLEMDRENNIIETKWQLSDYVYTAHGWNLGFYGRPLIKEKIIGRHSKCGIEVFTAKYTGPNINKITNNNNEKLEKNYFFTDFLYHKHDSNFSKDDKNIMKAVYKHYSQLDADMFKIMKEKFSLWDCYKSAVKIISLDMPEEYFEKYYSSIIKKIQHENENSLVFVDEIVEIFVQACVKNPTSALKNLCLKKELFESKAPRPQNNTSHQPAAF